MFQVWFFFRIDEILESVDYGTMGNRFKKKTPRFVN